MHEDKYNCTGGTIGWTEKERTQESRPPTAQSLGRGSACLPPQICGTLPRIESRGTPRGSSREGKWGTESSTLCSGGGSESLSSQMGTQGRVASRGTDRRSTTGCTWGEGGKSHNFSGTLPRMGSRWEARTGTVEATGGEGGSAWSSLGGRGSLESRESSWRTTKGGHGADQV